MHNRARTDGGYGGALRRLAIVVTIASLGASVAVVSGRARADAGDLRYLQSLTKSAVSVAVGSDAKRVFVASEGGVKILGVYRFTNPLTVFYRNPDGGLGVSHCFGATAVLGTECTPLPFSGDTRATAVAVSPDLQSVYVTTRGDQVLHFRLNATTGRYAYDTCYANVAGGPGGCEPFPGILDDPQSLAITDAGQRSLYVRTPTGIAALSRDGIGRLRFVSCVSAQSVDDGCGTKLDLVSTSSMAVAPDGSSVLLGGSSLYPIVYGLDRSDTSGALLFRSCLQRSRPSCGALGPGGQFSPVSDIAFGPDSNNAYLTHPYEDTVTTLVRTGPGATFAFDSCHTDVDRRGVIDGCTFTTYIANPKGVAASADGRSVYVSGADSDSLATFNRGTGGRLTPDQCFVEADPADPRCARTSGLDGATDVAVAPDGTSVHVAAVDGARLTSFTRDASGRTAIEPPPPGGDKTPPDGPPDEDSTPPETTIDAPAAAKVRGRSVTFTFTSSEARSTFECSVDGAGAGPCVSPFTLDGIRRGEHVLTVVAIDAAGNRDASPAEVRFKRGRRWIRIFPDAPSAQTQRGGRR